MFCQNAQSEDEVLELPNGGSDYHNSPHRGSVVREFSGLLGDLEDDEKEAKTRNAPSTLPDDKTEETSPAEPDAERLSGDLGQYADTSWSLTSPTDGVNPKQTMGLGDSTVSMRSSSSGLLLHMRRNKPRTAPTKDDPAARVRPDMIGVGGGIETSYIYFRHHC